MELRRVSRRTEKRYGIGDTLMVLDKLECLVDALAPRFIFNLEEIRLLQTLQLHPRMAQL